MGDLPRYESKAQIDTPGIAAPDTTRIWRMMNASTDAFSQGIATLNQMEDQRVAASSEVKGAEAVLNVDEAGVARVQAQDMGTISGAAYMKGALAQYAVNADTAIAQNSVKLQAEAFEKGDVKGYLDSMNAIRDGAMSQVPEQFRPFLQSKYDQRIAMGAADVSSKIHERDRGFQKADLENKAASLSNDIYTLSTTGALASDSGSPAAVFHSTLSEYQGVLQALHDAKFISKEEMTERVEQVKVDATVGHLQFDNTAAYKGLRSAGDSPGIAYNKIMERTVEAVRDGLATHDLSGGKYSMVGNGANYANAAVARSLEHARSLYEAEAGLISAQLDDASKAANLEANRLATLEATYRTANGGALTPSQSSELQRANQLASQRFPAQSATFSSKMLAISQAGNPYVAKATDAVIAAVTSSTKDPALVGAALDNLRKATANSEGAGAIPEVAWADHIAAHPNDASLMSAAFPPSKGPNEGKPVAKPDAPPTDATNFGAPRATGEAPTVTDGATSTSTIKTGSTSSPLNIFENDQKDAAPGSSRPAMHGNGIDGEPLQSYGGKPTSETKRPPTEREVYEELLMRARTQPEREKILDALMKKATDQYGKGVLKQEANFTYNEIMNGRGTTKGAEDFGKVMDSLVESKTVGLFSANGQYDPELAKSTFTFVSKLGYVPSKIASMLDTNAPPDRQTGMATFYKNLKDSNIPGITDGIQKQTYWDTFQTYMTKDYTDRDRVNNTRADLRGAETDKNLESIRKDYASKGGSEADFRAGLDAVINGKGLANAMKAVGAVWGEGRHDVSSMKLDRETELAIRTEYSRQSAGDYIAGPTGEKERWTNAAAKVIGDTGGVTMTRGVPTIAAFAPERNNPDFRAGVAMQIAESFNRGAPNPHWGRFFDGTAVTQGQVLATFGSGYGDGMAKEGAGNLWKDALSGGGGPNLGGAIKGIDNETFDKSINLRPVPGEPGKFHVFGVTPVDKDGRTSMMPFQGAHGEMLKVDMSRSYTQQLKATGNIAIDEALSQAIPDLNKPENIKAKNLAIHALETPAYWALQAQIRHNTALGYDNVRNHLSNSLVNDSIAAVKKWWTTGNLTDNPTGVTR